MITGVGDLVLIHHKKKPVAHARVEEITPDRKPGWWQARLLILQVPAQEVTWILREEYLDGGEFTMGGETMRLERIPAPQPVLAPETEPDPRPDSGPGSDKVVDLSQRRRRDS